MEGATLTGKGRRRHWFQFSLRTLLLVVLVASLGLSWLAVKLKQAEEQRVAVETLRKLGARVWYDYEFAIREDGCGCVINPAAQPSQPIWLRKLLGGDFFDRVTCVEDNTGCLGEIDPAVFGRLGSIQELDLWHRQGSNFGDLLESLSVPKALRRLKMSSFSREDSDCQSVIRLGRFVNLQDVRLSGPFSIEGFENLTELRKLSLFVSGRVAASCVKSFTELKNLEDLYFNGIEMTDRDLENLQGLRNLKHLLIAGRGITDAGLESLRELTRLKSLTLSSTSITDQGLRQFRELTALAELHLHDADITDAGLAHLGGFDQLTTLVLSHTKITGPGLAHLGTLNALEVLDLGGAPVVDSGLVHLRKLAKLRSLNLSYTKITSAGLRNLRDLAALESLDLHATAVTDDGLAHLSGLPQLEDLELEDTNVTLLGLIRAKAILRARKLGFRAPRLASTPGAIVK